MSTMTATMNPDEQAEAKSIGQAIQKLRIAMLTLAEDGQQLSARPLTVADHNEGVLRFMVDKTAHWVPHAATGAAVNLSFSDPSSGIFVSLSGRSSVSHDRTQIDALWSPADSAFFEDSSDPRIAILEVQVDEGEYWTGPGNGAALGVKMAAKAMGFDVSMGEKGPVQPR